MTASTGVFCVFHSEMLTFQSAHARAKFATGLECRSRPVKPVAKNLPWSTLVQTVPSGWWVEEKSVEFVFQPAHKGVEGRDLGVVEVKAAVVRAMAVEEMGLREKVWMFFSYCRCILSWFYFSTEITLTISAGIYPGFTLTKYFSSFGHWHRSFTNLQRAVPLWCCHTRQRRNDILCRKRESFPGKSLNKVWNHMYQINIFGGYIPEYYNLLHHHRWLLCTIDFKILNLKDSNDMGISAKSLNRVKITNNVCTKIH